MENLQSMHLSFLPQFSLPQSCMISSFFKAKPALYPVTIDCTVCSQYVSYYTRLHDKPTEETERL